MNNIKIFYWNEISKKYERGALLLGNGSSIAVDESFRYGSLLENAKKKFSLGGIGELFNHFKTEDFELILRLVWQSREIIDITGEHHCIHYHRLKWIYDEIKNGLIDSVREKHPDYYSVDKGNNLEKISNFLKDFNTVISLNYDLIVYWASLRLQDASYSFKDCFINNEFKENWQELKKPIRGAKHSTLIFYPHGNLILYKDILSSEFKLSTNKETNLLKTILDKWSNGSISPLFVSEGTVDQKVKSIKDSYYLSVIYREVLTEAKETLVVYGWGFGNQDIHILKQMKNCGIKNIAVSVYKNDKEYCYNVSKLIKKELGDTIEIEFFHSDSQGCWIY